MASSETPAPAGEPRPISSTRNVRAVLRCRLHDSDRVRQVARMFDLPPASTLRETFAAEFPDRKAEWRIGLVVGPSGSGKTSLARRAFGRDLAGAVSWPADRAVLDCLGEMRVEEIVQVFTAVGFGAPPSWLKPHHVLSGGERFRCDLARALAAAMIAAREPAGGKRRKGGAQTMAAGRTRSLARLPLVAFDEFTSAVDRTAARIASAALVKALRGGGIHCRFVAITCHYDVAEWLEPDWIVDTGPGTTHWRQLRRPAIELSVFRCRQCAWRLFARHHYLSGSLNFGSRCFLACWSDTPVAFCATLPLLGRRGIWRISRLVTLPDYQGIGIGTRLAEAVGDLHRQQRDRLRLTTSHPAMLSHCSRSARWQLARVMKHGSHKCGFTSRYTGSTGRSVTSFEYLGPAGEGAEGTLPPGRISTTQSNRQKP